MPEPPSGIDSGVSVAESIIRIAVASAWVLAPPVLIGLAIREWRKASRPGPRTGVIPIAVAIAVLVDWACFLFLLALGFIGGFGSHFITTRRADWFLMASVIILFTSMTSKVAWGKLALASFLVFALWIGSELVA